MAGTSSVNCVSCRIPHQCLHSLNAWTPFSEKALLFTDFCFVASPSQNSVPRIARNLGALRSSCQSHRGLDPKSLNFRGPVAILFISRDTCSDSIAKLFRACFLWGIAQISRDMLQNGGIAQMCLCKTKYQGGVSHLFGGVLASPKKYRAIWSIAAIVSQYRAIWGH